MNRLRLLFGFPSPNPSIEDGWLINLSDCLAYFAMLAEQEQGIAAEIVHVVIAGNSVEIPHGILNRQVCHLMLACP